MADTTHSSKDVKAVHLESVAPNDHGQYSSEADAARGAAILEEENQLSLWYNAKLHWRALLICSASFTAGMAFGYDTVVNGASISMPAFFLYFGEIGPTGPYLPSIWTSLWTAMSALCQAIGAYCAGFFLDRVGRKWPAVGAGLITVVGTAVQYTSHTRGSLMAGKMVTGLGIGVAMATGTSYASEVAPLKLRAPVQSALVLFTVFMQGAALGIIRSFVPNIAQQAFRDVFAIQWAVGLILILAFAVTPESPVYLINNHQYEKAHKVMCLIYGKENDPEARLAYLIKLIREENHSEHERGTYFDCFKGTDLKRTLTVMLIYTAANFAGAAFLSQSIYFLITAGLPAIHSFDVSVGGFGLASIIIVASWFVGEYIHRRTGFLAGLAINFVCMLIVGCLYYSKTKGALWAIAVVMNLDISLQTSLIQGMGWPIAAELSSYRLRAKTISIGVICQTLSTWLTLFTVPYMYNVDSGDLGARTGFVFVGTTVLLLVAGYFMVPDTTGLTAEQIDHAYDQRVSPRQFRKIVGSEEFSPEEKGLEA